MHWSTSTMKRHTHEFKVTLERKWKLTAHCRTVLLMWLLIQRHQPKIAEESWILHSNQKQIENSALTLNHNQLISEGGTSLFTLSKGRCSPITYLMLSFTGFYTCQDSPLPPSHTPAKSFLSLLVFLRRVEEKFFDLSSLTPSVLK